MPGGFGNPLTLPISFPNKAQGSFRVFKEGMHHTEIAEHEDHCEGDDKDDTGS